MPVIASSLVLLGEGSLWLVALAWIGMTSISLIALVLASEGKDHDLRDIE